MSDAAIAAPRPGSSTWRIARRVLFLLISVVTLYVLLPQLIDLWTEVPRLRSIRWEWFVVMFGLESASFVCTWWLLRVALPEVSWYLAATSQLASNAVSRFVPGGAATGAVLSYRMLSVAKIDRGPAGTALAATGLITTATLFSLPLVAAAVALFGAPVPRNLLVVAWGGGLLFALMFGLGVLLVTTDEPLRIVGRRVEQLSRWLQRRFHRGGGVTADRLLSERDRVTSALGSRWVQALAASVGKWTLDYLALVAALHAVGADPQVSVVLLAYGAAAVLSMVPITPGGLGFVEAGLVGTLTLAGVSAPDALLATLAYRIVSYWLPMPAGVIAYLMFRHRYGRPPPSDALPAT